MRKTIKIKNDLHSLIDKTDNNKLLEIVYKILDSKGGDKEGELINSLSPDQKKELYEAYDESFDEANLIDLQKLKTKHSKWFVK